MEADGSGTAYRLEVQQEDERDRQWWRWWRRVLSTRRDEEEAEENDENDLCDAYTFTTEDGQHDEEIGEAWLDWFVTSYCPYSTKLHEKREHYRSKTLAEASTGPKSTEEQVFSLAHTEAPKSDAPQNLSLPSLGGDSRTGTRTMGDASATQDSRFALSTMDDGELFEAERTTLTGEAPTYTVLEVLSGRKSALLGDILIVIFLFSTLWTITMLMLSMTVFAREVQHEQFTVIFSATPTWILYACSSMAILIFLVALAVACMYSYLVAISPRRNVQREQVWIVLNVLAVCFFLFPIDAISTFLEHNAVAVRVVLDPYVQAIEHARVIAFVVMLYLFPWCIIHTYGTDTPYGTKWMNLYRFYRGKVLVFCIYVAWNVVTFTVFRATPHFVPFTTIIYGLRSYFELGRRFPKMLIVSIVTTLIEGVLTASVIRAFLHTERNLKHCFYHTMRPKKVGFATFILYTRRFITYFLFNAWLAAAAFPIGSEQMLFLFRPGQNLWYVGQSGKREVMLGMYVIILTWMTVLAFLMLPSTAKLPRRRKSEYGSLQADTEPVTYLPRSVEAVQHPNCFVMEKHVEALNYAWLAYYGGTKKLEKYREQTTLYEKFEFLHDKKTDTHVALVRNRSNIIISFRGSKSFLNFYHDIQIRWWPLAAMFPELQSSNSRYIKRARVHCGFAKCYKSVAAPMLSTLADLQGEEPLPVLITGHSLGGALATLCAFDLGIKKQCDLSSMVVSSFGAPKVGNRAFRQLYDDIVKQHWRVELSLDGVPRLPCMPYEHAGKQALLTPAGELLLDPNPLDMHVYKEQRFRKRYHSKSQYLKCIKDWCRNHHGSQYMPMFFDFIGKKTEQASQLTDQPLRYEDYLDTLNTVNSGGKFSAEGLSDMLHHQPSIPQDVLDKWIALVTAVERQLEEKGQCSAR
mmetsp:Transcript_5186/g.15515  ORF Transcript_5186/g.15515 Transcript_5186/m.15515 type:complete len:915 (+) Transcript_5186:147-2891(+)|eukprot:CAMPEP_0198734658 /NCGR_PEP_ID=MMETSP1475-20131203/54219_1 /TAXON_ID= ORGANISM="Unidentified sp., Strain CCMP1999" /NCGR_SAMPLE_ID=MMETSP1475 /ASSEMBLY_ACC=CAM_ASM_001111 /LENGTH=914 /DNA_ID=CAMNT_0044498173 /DNA_START=151 /DNA_END=2895 /DNA_ORIENTATION=-